MIHNVAADPSNHAEISRHLQTAQNSLSASSPFPIQPIDSQIHQLSLNHHVIENGIPINEAGHLNQRNDDVILISSGTSATMYDSSASTVSLNLAALYGANQQMDILNDSGISVDSDDDINRASEFIEIDYIVQELYNTGTPSYHPSSHNPLSIPHNSLRIPTPHPTANQNYLQNPAPLRNAPSIEHFEQFVEVVEYNVQPPSPLPPRRLQNLHTNPSNDEYFRCVICMDPVIGNDPHATPCGHTVCHADLNEWLNHHHATTCPYCREPITYAECVRLYVI